MQAARNCHVYWIRHKTHTDMFSQGYIGVTVKLPKYRLSEHVVKANSGAILPISKALRKYGADIVLDTLVVASQEYCYEVEAKLRPSPRIGWNLAIGGEMSGTTGRHHTVETREKISKANSGRTASVEVKAKMSQSQLGKKMSDETKAKIAAARIGKRHSEETRQKMSASHSTRNIVKEHK